jgi:assimilatory nitrate reductase catalytic subunit
VKTHCCFCGQQCGIQLKVQGRRVVGFEPWEEFPFNRGMLCPKGVRRYLQSAHPDRLLHPLMREHGRLPHRRLGRGARPRGAEIRAIQERHGKDAVAVYGGASLTTEKAYLIGKLARLGIGTRHVDYNGRLCMVSAGTAYKLAFGVDRSPIPWSDIPEAQVAFVAGANVAECAPITTQYLWQMRDRGGRLIVSDPRMTPITRNADLYLPVRPGTDVALHLACCG